MSRIKIDIDSKELEGLYIQNNLSLIEIGKIYNCTPVTIKNRIMEFNIHLKDSTTARIKYKRKNFSGDGIERSYMMGFRLGDLNVYKPKSKSYGTIIARCHTTKIDQVTVIRKIFDKYGRVTVSRSDINKYNVNCFLDNSFVFLLDKTMPILKGKNEYYAFIAGYTDAEGNFILNQGRGRFKIDAYDYFILNKINEFLINQICIVKMRKIEERGKFLKNGVIRNQDLWRININEARSLERFINNILPFMKHKKRISDAKLVLNNIIDRRKNGTI